MSDTPSRTRRIAEKGGADRVWHTSQEARHECCVHAYFSGWGTVSVPVSRELLDDMDAASGVIVELIERVRDEHTEQCNRSLFFLLPSLN